MHHPFIVNTSPFSVKQTADRLVTFLDKRQIRLFARINHSEAATAVGLSLPDEEVVIFGDPRMGTYLMQECPPVGIELPLRMLMWFDQQSYIGYIDPLSLLDDYILLEHKADLEKMSKLMEMLVKEVIGTD